MTNPRLGSLRVDADLEPAPAARPARRVAGSRSVQPPDASFKAFLERRSTDDFDDESGAEGPTLPHPARHARQGAPGGASDHPRQQVADRGGRRPARREPIPLEAMMARAESAGNAPEALCADDESDWSDWFAHDDDRRGAAGLLRRLALPGATIAAILALVAAAAMMLSSPGAEPPANDAAIAPITNTEMRGGETIFAATVSSGPRELTRDVSTQPDATTPVTEAATPPVAARPEGGVTRLQRRPPPDTSGALAPSPGGTAPGETMLAGAQQSAVGGPVVAASPYETTFEVPTGDAPSGDTPAGDPGTADPVTAAMAAAGTVSGATGEVSPSGAGPESAGMDGAAAVVDSAAQDNAAGPSATIQMASVTTDVNMRAGPANEEPVVTVVHEGEPVELIGCEIWCKVVYEGEHGWIYRDFVKQ